MATLFAGICVGASGSVLGQQIGGGDRKDKFDIPYEAKLDPVFHYRKSTFAPYLNGKFSVRASAIVTELTLVSVSDCGARASQRAAAPSSEGKEGLTGWRAAPRDMMVAEKTGGECFSLLFRADRKLSPLQTIYKLNHGALGTFSLFLVDVTKRDDRDGLYYEAVINHAQG